MKFNSIIVVVVIWARITFLSSSCEQTLFLILFYNHAGAWLESNWIHLKPINEGSYKYRFLLYFPHLFTSELVFESERWKNLAKFIFFSYHTNATENQHQLCQGWAIKIVILSVNASSSPSIINIMRQLQFLRLYWKRIDESNTLPKTLGT